MIPGTILWTFSLRLVDGNQVPPLLPHTCFELVAMGAEALLADIPILKGGRFGLRAATNMPNKGQ